MVSYQQLDQHGIMQIVLHERETTSSGRPKPIRITEDATSFYTYTRTGKQSKVPKTDTDKYYDFLTKEVIFKNVGSNPRLRGQIGTLNQVSGNTADRKIRMTPITDYEKSMGYGAINPADLGFKMGDVNASSDKRLLKQHTDERARLHFLKLEQAEQERLAKELAIRLAKLREAIPKEKPKKETVFVAPPKPVEVEPIKEVAKYSPLMIAGVIAVIVVLFFRRRA